MIYYCVLSYIPMYFICGRIYDEKNPSITSILFLCSPIALPCIGIGVLLVGIDSILRRFWQRK